MLVVRSLSALSPFQHLDHIYIPIEMAIFSSNRGYIGRLKTTFSRSFCSFRCCEDEEKVRTIVTRLFGERLCEME